MRVVFMGTPDFSVPVLDSLVKAGHEIACVYCQPPRPAGRGKKERSTPVHARAAALGLSVRHPVSLKTAENQTEFADLQADVAVVVAYGLILPQAVLDAPRLGCLNIHASLLPRWRGAAPIHRAILAGDRRTGVCIMQMEAGLDTGPVLQKAEVEIGPEDTTASLHDRLSALGASEIVSALEKLETLVPVPQPEQGVTYAAKIDKAEARIDWSRPAVEVDRQIRGLSPFPGAWSTLGDIRIKLLASRVSEGHGAPGEAVVGPIAHRLHRGSRRVAAIATRWKRRTGCCDLFERVADERGHKAWRRDPMFPTIIGTVVIAGIVGYASERSGFTHNGYVPSIIICVGGAFLMYFVTLMFGIGFRSPGINAIASSVGALIIVPTRWRK